MQYCKGLNKIKFPYSSLQLATRSTGKNSDSNTSTFNENYLKANDS